MILMKTLMNVADNSGAVVAQCIKVLRSKPFASVGDRVVVSIQRVRGGKKIKRGEVKQAVIVRTKAPITRMDGTQVRFSDNACVLLSSKDQPFAKRIDGVVPGDELRRARMMKVVALARREI